MAIIFNGDKYAQDVIAGLKIDLDRLEKNNISPRLVTISIGDSKASAKYLTLKKKKAEEIGAEVEILNFPSQVGLAELTIEINKLNTDSKTHGIMIQLPIDKKFKTKYLIDEITREKDVDGMKEDSPFVAPVVKAVLFALKNAQEVLATDKQSYFVVVGYKGFVGRKILRTLKDMAFKVDGIDIGTKNFVQKTKKADVIIAATGKAGLIKKDVIKEGAVIIDVGAPRPEVGDGTIKKASFITPVPGGIGPMTIAYLLENLVEAAIEKYH